MSKICIWGAWYESKNAGDQAILMTVVQLLAQKIPDVELVVFSNRPRLTKNYMNPVYPVRAVSQRYSLPTVLRELATCDLFLVGGGTPFYDDWFHLSAMFLMAATARLAGKPVMAYAVSARPIDSALGRLLTKVNLRLINMVTVREPEALERLRSLGAREPIHVFTDPAVILEPVNAAAARAIIADEGIQVNKKPIVAICPHFFSSDHSYRVHHYERFSEASIEHYHQVLAQAADWLAARGQVLFIPFNTESPDDDRGAITRVLGLMEQGKMCRVVSRQYGPRELAGILKECELVLAVRLHAAVLASSVHTPTVAISYGPKVVGFMRRIGQEANCVRFESLKTEELTLRLANVWHNREGIRGKLAVSMEQMREFAARNAETAVQLIA